MRTFSRQPGPGGHTSTRRAPAALLATVALVALSAIGGVAATGAQSLGAPQVAHADDPYMLYNESWENLPGRVLTTLNNYVGFSGERYSADPAAVGMDQASNCNGIVSAYRRDDGQGRTPPCVPDAPTGLYNFRRDRAHAIPDLGVSVQEALTAFPHWQYVNGEPKGPTQNVAVGYSYARAMNGSIPANLVPGLRILEKAPVSVGTAQRTYRVQFSMVEAGCPGSFDVLPDRTSLSVYLKDGSNEIKIAEGISPCTNGSTKTAQFMAQTNWTGTAANYRFDVPYASKSGTLGVVFRNMSASTNGNLFGLDDYKEGTAPINPTPTVTPTETPTTPAEPEGVQVFKNGPARAMAGDTVRYQVSWTNRGPGATDRATVITDTLPAEFTLDETSLQADSGSVVVTGGRIEWTIPPGQAQGSGSMLSFSGTLRSNLNRGQVVINYAAISSGNCREPNCIAEARTEIYEPDNNRITIEKENNLGANAYVTPGQAFQYHFIINNRGNLPRNNIVLIDDLPEGLEFYPLDQYGWTFTGNRATYQSLDLRANQVFQPSLWVRVKADAVPGTVLRNVGTIEGGASFDECRADPTLEGCAVDPNPPTVDGPTIELKKRNLLNDPREVSAGDEFSYEIVARNTGSRDATGVVITDRLPEGLEFAAATQPGWVSPLTGNTAVSQPLAIARGSSATLRLTVRVASTAQPGDVLVNVSAVNGMSTPEQCAATHTRAGCGVDQDPPSVIGRLLELKKYNDLGTNVTVKPGQDFAYTIVAKNNSGGVVRDAVLTDTLPDGLVWASRTQAGWTMSGQTATSDPFTLQPGEEKPFNLRVRVRAEARTGTVLKNVVVQRTGPSPTECIANPAQLGCAVDETPPVVDSQVLTIYKESNIAPNVPARLGDRITYSIEVTNISTRDIVGIRVIDQLPDGLAFEPSFQANWTFAGNRATADLFALAPGAKKVLTLRTIAIQQSLPTRNYAMITAYELIMPTGFSSSQGLTMAALAGTGTSPSLAECKAAPYRVGCAYADVKIAGLSDTPANSAAPSAAPAPTKVAEPTATPAPTKAAASDPVAPKADNPAPAAKDTAKGNAKDTAKAPAKAANPAPAPAAPSAKSGWGFTSLMKFLLGR